MLIKCAPDEHGCIDLLAVLRIMNQIDQEQAWALAYQLAALAQRLWPASNDCATIESLAQIYINQEGELHEKSLLLLHKQQSRATQLPHPRNSSEPEAAAPARPVREPKEAHKSAELKEACESQAAAKAADPLPPTPPITPELEGDERCCEWRRQRASTEFELVASLGIALFWALDFGIPNDEERKLGHQMELLIVQTQSGLSLAELERLCVQRLSPTSRPQAARHYRAVCKALVTDTLELALLLDKIYTATLVMNGGRPLASGAAQHTSSATNTSDQSTTTTTADYHLHLHQLDQDELSELGLPLASLRALKINDWARLWMQVIRELRQRRMFAQQQQQPQYEGTAEKSQSAQPPQRAAELQTV